VNKLISHYWLDIRDFSCLPFVAPVSAHTDEFFSARFISEIQNITHLEVLHDQIGQTYFNLQILLPTFLLCLLVMSTVAKMTSSKLLP